MLHLDDVGGCVPSRRLGDLSLEAQQQGVVNGEAEGRQARRRAVHLCLARRGRSGGAQLCGAVLPQRRHRLAVQGAFRRAAADHSEHAALQRESSSRDARETRLHDRYASPCVALPFFDHAELTLETQGFR